MILPSAHLPALPPAIDFDTAPILKALATANRALAELKGTAKSLPHQGILIDTLFLQEALASSEIENIVTTQDEAYKASLFSETGTPEAKEVARYRDAMRQGYDEMREKELITENMLIGMFRVLKQRDDSYRTTPGTILRNDQTGDTVYAPPQDPQEIIRLMAELETFINTLSSDEIDPLIKMALIHHQFESIHPFPDGNGRVGRILNVLYLTHSGLLDVPILYLSRGINASKSDYYKLLQAVRDEGAWEDWIIYVLKMVEITATSTLQTIIQIRDLMQKTKHRMREELPKIYSQDLLNNLFHQPYTRIELVARDLNVHYNTAAAHLRKLAEADFLHEEKFGQSKYFINQGLVDILINVSREDNDNSNSTG